MKPSLTSTSTKLGTALTLTLLTGCMNAESTEDDLTDAQSEPSDDELRSSAFEGCESARLIGILDDPTDSCDLGSTLPDGWTAMRLFADGSPNLAALGAGTPGELGRYCAYDPEPWVLESGYTEMMNFIDASPLMPVGTVGTDCLGEVPQAGLDNLDVRQALGQAFHDNIDALTIEDLGASQANRKPIAVGVIDTVSAQVGADPQLVPANEHGLQMAALIKDIACPGNDATCTNEIGFALAMPREDWASGPDWIGGGDNGTQGDIAMAIYEAVATWQAERAIDPAGSPPRLILNLSLGWEREVAEATDPWRGPARAVGAALKYASCQGALVFVAAGNNPDEKCPEEHTGVLAPADLEQAVAPTASECAALGFPVGGTPQHPVFGPDNYRPLVYAVGGVDEFDHPLINARLEGNPRLVALGTSGVSKSESHTALTGTSVSTAVVSGAATLIWSYRPDLRPHQVAKFLYTSGWALGTTADMTGTGGASGMRRVSVCAALDDACAGKPALQCPHPGCQAGSAPGNTNFVDYFAEVEAAVLASTSVTIPAANGSAPVCTGSSSSTLASPQPEVPVCPYCNVDVPPETGSPDPDDVVNMTITSDYQGTILAVTMIAYDQQRNVTTFEFGEDIVASLNDPTIGVTQAIVDTPDLASATLIFEIDEVVSSSSQSNPVVVNHLE